MSARGGSRRAQLAPTGRTVVWLHTRSRREVASAARSYKKWLLRITENLIKHKSDIYVKISNNNARQDALAGKESHHSQSIRSQEVYHSVSIRHLDQLLSCSCDECDPPDQSKDPTNVC